MLTVSTGNYCELVSLDVHEESFDVTGYFIYVLGSMEVCLVYTCLLYTSPSPRDVHKSRMPSSA